MLFNNKKKQFAEDRIQKILIPIFDEMELQNVALDDLGSQTLMVYYYGMLVHLGHADDVDNKLVLNQFTRDLMEYFDYSMDEAVEWALNIEHFVETQEYDTTNVLFEHGYEALDDLNDGEQAEVKKDYSDIVDHLKAYEAENPDAVPEEQVSPMEDLMHGSQDSSETQENDDSGHWSLNVDLINQFIENDWFQQYEELNEKKLEKLSEQWSKLSFENFSLDRSNEVSMNLSQAQLEQWNNLVYEYIGSYQDSIKFVIDGSWGSEVSDELKKKLTNNIAAQLLMLIITSSFIDIEEIPYYAELKKILLDGYIYTKWEGQYPDGKLGIYKN
ncbi:hypothetical protein D3P96_06270 [Weissella viridescens]|uniref:Uncharacterized protein n=1 Tax=Weissella viridescens TaxID=1629 RepID=A0A3P2RK14_WEIVI|nr:Imm48 family immunity protein [Weissella viridescens]RRG17758.1 hypothetical protein D3P96_06270 [Weissella viridescens]